MSRINLLDELTIDKIAAGEVIERPASIVKELVENAIDGNANAITIEIKEGGIGFIRITDNGCGIDAEDVPTAFLRHATSKISGVNDLLSIRSLGFRGEALSSIAAISQVELITKTTSALTGVRYQIAGGKELSLEHIGCPEGTTFIIRNVFFNVPARKKFLKTPQTEGAHIFELVQQLALSHPDISFQFIMNGKNRFYSSGNGNIKDIIYTIYGKEVAKGLLPVSISNPELELKVNGFIGKPIISRGNRSYENYYINKRYVKSKVIYRAIEDAYKTFTMVHKFPFVCLSIDLQPEQMDVNVHPTKMDIRFHQEQSLYHFLKSEIKNVLLNQDLIPDVSLSNEKKKKADIQAPTIQPFEKKRLMQERISDIPALHTKLDVNIDFRKDNLNKHKEINTQSENLRKKECINITQDNLKVALNSERQNSKPVDLQDKQIKKDTVLEKKSVITDAISEKKTDNIKNDTIFYEHVEQENKINNHLVKEEPVKGDYAALTMKKEAPVQRQMSFLDSSLAQDKAFSNYQIIGQLFKTYWLIEYDRKLFIMDQHAAHEKINYERFMKHMKDKKNKYVQQLSPAIIITLTPKEAVVYEEYKEFFADFGFEIEAYGGAEYCIQGVPTDLYGIADQDAFVKLLDEINENVHGTDTSMIAEKIATMACKASVKGNQKLSVMEAQALINELMTLDSPFTCPHGRPTIISMTQTEIEKKFKRIQN